MKKRHIAGIIVFILVCCCFIVYEEYTADTFSIVAEENLENDAKIEDCYIGANDNINVLLKDGQQTTICRLVRKDPDILKNGIHVLHNDGVVYIYDDGIREIEGILGKKSETLEEATHFFRGKLTALFDKGRACIISYDPYTGNREEIVIKDRDKKIIQDIFFYEGEIRYLADYDDSEAEKKGGFLSKIFDNCFEKTSAYISATDMRLPTTVAGKSSGGISPLRVKGCVVGDTYYFPTINGIYRYNLKTEEGALINEENNSDCDRIILKKIGSYYYQVKRKVTAIDSMKFKVETLSGNTIIQKMDAKFNEIQTTEVDIMAESVYFGEEKVLLSQLKMTPTEVIFWGDETYDMISAEIDLDTMEAEWHEKVNIGSYPGTTENLWAL